MAALRGETNEKDADVAALALAVWAGVLVGIGALHR